MPDAEAAVLGDAVDAREKLLRNDRAVVRLARFGAVVAGAAVIDAEIASPKYVQQFGAPAAGAFGVVDNLPKLRARDLLLLLVGDFVEEVRLLRDVARAEQQQAIARQAVASRASGFLIIAFDVLRQVVVNDPADVRLVDAHAERDGRADDPRVVAQKLLLIAPAFGGVEPGVIGTRGETAAGQGFGGAFGGGAARAVDDAALVFPFPDEIDDLFQPADLSARRDR